MAKLKRESAREQIKDSIVKGIFDGTYPPGARLREKELAEYFGTSQAPVREALRELEGLQYVVTIPYKGTLVREVSNEDIANAYRLRGLLEEMAIEVISENGINSTNIKDLKKIAEKADKAAKSGNIKNYAKYNIEFHKFIIEMANLPMAEHMWHLVSFPIQVQNVLDTTDLSMIDFSSEHMEVISLIESSNFSEAGSLLRKHANKVKEHLLAPELLLTKLH